MQYLFFKHALEHKNDCLDDKLKKVRKKYKQLKKSVQMERYEYGVNPFIPYDTCRTKYKEPKHNKKKRVAPTVQYVALPFSNFPISAVRIENDNNIVEGEYREICGSRDSNNGSFRC